jgi:hypothetical protein
MSNYGDAQNKRITVSIYTELPFRENDINHGGVGRTKKQQELAIQRADRDENYGSEPKCKPVFPAGRR